MRNFHPNVGDDDDLHFLLFTLHFLLYLESGHTYTALDGDKARIYPGTCLQRENKLGMIRCSGMEF